MKYANSFKSRAASFLSLSENLHSMYFVHFQQMVQQVIQSSNSQKSRRPQHKLRPAESPLAWRYKFKVNISHKLISTD